MKTEAKSKSDAAKENRSERPIHDVRIGQFRLRLKEAMAGQSLKAFGKKSGLSDGALFSYLSGETYPTLDRLDAIAHATGRSAAWFLGVESGLEVPSQVLNQDALTMAVQIATEALEERRARLPANKFAELVSIVYELLVDGLPEAKILRLARAAAGEGGENG